MRTGRPDGGAEGVQLPAEGAGGVAALDGAAGGVAGGVLRVADGAARAVGAALGVASAANVGVRVAGEAPGRDGDDGAVERGDEGGAEAALVEQAVGLEVGGVGAEERKGDEDGGGGAEGDAGVGAAGVEARGAHFGHAPRLRADDAVAGQAPREVDGVGAGERGDSGCGGPEGVVERAQRGAERMLAAAGVVDEVGGEQPNIAPAQALRAGSAACAAAPRGAT